MSISASSVTLAAWSSSSVNVGAFLAGAGVPGSGFYLVAGVLGVWVSRDTRRLAA